MRIGTQELKIAAIALANNLILLTRNRRDFGRIAGLMLDDGSVWGQQERGGASVPGTGKGPAPDALVGPHARRPLVSRRPRA